MGTVQFRIWCVDIDMFNDPRRVSCNNNEVRDIFSDHASGPNGNTSAYSDSREHYHITTKPAVFADIDGRAKLGALSSISQKGV